MTMQIAIEGQHLTSQQSHSTGSRAMGDTHQQTKMAYAQRLARKVEPWFDEQLIRRLIAKNLGDVDPDDIPVLRFGIHRQVDPEKLTTLVTLGAIVEADPIAEQWGISLADPDRADQAVLKRPAAPALGAPATAGQPGDPNQQQAPTSVDPPPTPGPEDGPTAGGPQRSARTAPDIVQHLANAQDETLQGLLGDATRRADPLFQAHMGRLRDAVLTATAGGHGLTPLASSPASPPS
jgi:hypothetical protein